MQLKEIFITNIASLKGNHRLQFSPEFFHDNLFAITGPTGSGKSTILAAISLALYGSHYKDKLSTTELITLGEASGRAEIYFQYQGETYKSIWEGTVLKANGEPLAKPKIGRTLFRKSRDSFEAINQRIEDILKLSFEQFCKTVILNQGEFSRFINSDFKERKEILERLADNNKLAMMNIRLNEEMKEIRNIIENKQNWVAGRQHLTEENVKGINAKMISLKSDLQFYHQEFSELSKNHKKFLEILANLKSRADNVMRRTNLQEQLNGKNKELNEIKSKYQSEQKILDESLALFQKEEPELRLAAETLVKKLHLEENLAKANSSKVQKQNLLKQLINEEASLLESIDQNLKKKKQLSEQIKFRLLTPSEKGKIEIGLSNLTELKQQFSLAKKELELIEQELAQKDLTENQIKLELVNLKKQIDESQPLLVSSQNLSTETEELSQQILIMEASNVSLTSHLKYFKDIERSLISSEILGQLIETKKQVIREKNQKLEFYELAISINHCHGESLKAGSCVVCGQDYMAKVLKPEIRAAIQGDLKQEKILITDLEKELIFQEDAGFKINQLFVLNSIKTLHEFDFQLAELKKKKSQSLLLLEETRKQEQSLALLQERINNQKKNQAQFESQKQVLLEKISILQLKLKKIAHDKIEKIKAIETILETTFDESHTSELSIDLKISGEIDYLNQTGVLKDGQLKNLNERKIAEQLQIQNIEEETQKLGGEIAEKNVFLKNLIGEANPKILLQEKKSKLDLLTQVRNKTQEQLHQNELGVKDFEGRLKMAQEQIDALSNLIMSLFHQFRTESAALTKRELKLWRENATYSHFLKGILENLDLSKSLETIDLEAVVLIAGQASETLSSHNEFIRRIEKEVIEGEANLKTVADQQEQILTANKLIEEKTKILNRLKNLYDVIGKDDFRNFILGLIEKQLLILANSELKNLCNDRYELVQGTKKTSQTEFFVIDKLSGGHRRNIATLSGGETFLISLAMALGLAEMTRGQAEINSFFIDEGFGTLDQDAIGEVLDVLEKMQSRGKQIGVISHIKSLTDRISVNIKLVKNGQGHSHLEIIQN